MIQAACRTLLQRLPSTVLLHAGDLVVVPHLEPIREGPHVRVLVLEELVPIWHDPHRPTHDPRVPGGLEAEPEVARVLIVDTEGVAGPVGVGIHVRRKPFLCIAKVD